MLVVRRKTKESLLSYAGVRNCVQMCEIAWGLEDLVKFSRILVAFLTPLKLPTQLWEDWVKEGNLQISPQKQKAVDGPKKKNILGSLISLNFWDFINTSPCFLQRCRNPGFGECRGSLNLLHFRRNFSSFMQGKWHIISNVNVIIKSNYFTILLPSLDIVFAIIAVINHMVSINSLTTWGQIMPAGGIDDFRVSRCRAESHHPREWQGFGSLSSLTDEQEGEVSDTSHNRVGSENMKAPNLCFGQKKQIYPLPLQCHKIHPCDFFFVPREQGWTAGWFGAASPGNSLWPKAGHFW